MAKIASAELRKTTSVAFMLSASANPGDRPAIAAVAEVEEALRSAPTPSSSTSRSATRTRRR